VRSIDTSPAAHQVQLDAYRAMGARRRAELAVEMSEDLRLVTIEGLRERHPGIDDRELHLLLVELWHGHEIAASVRRSLADRPS
jgi:hypothetical protein